VTACDKFVGENLIYFFVGRPAFKTKVGGEASYWQCPAVFILRSLGNASVKRIHPFDTGAFIDRLLPNYLTLFPLERFNLGSECDIIGKLISIFFGDAESYMYGSGMGEREFRKRYDVSPRHQEVEALTRLYNDRPATFDDRGKCVEVQVETDIGLVRSNLIGVVVPHPYLLEPELISKFEELGCRIESYGVFPLQVENYYATIYERVKKIIDGMVQ